MKQLLFVTLYLISHISFASVVKSLDENKSCQLYRVTTEETPIRVEEVVVNDHDAYGLTFVDMEINFKDKSVSVQPIINIILGLNRNLIQERATIASNNPDFKYLINQLNRRIFVFEKMCISNKNEIIYAKEFETKDQKTI